MYSKSKIKQGLNCEKALYLSIYQKFLAKYSKGSMDSFKRGTDVGDFARTFFPEGVLIPGIRKNDKLARTKKALELGLPLFEAAFDYEDILAQVDLLVPEDGKFKVIEVKSGTSVKEDYLQDLAIQYLVLTNQSLTPLSFSSFNFWLVNKDAKSDQELFKEVDVTKEVSELAEKIKPLILSLISKMKIKMEPEVTVGSQCFSPYPCPFMDHCWKKKIEVNKTVLVLPWDQREKYLKQKKLYLRDTDLDREIVDALEAKEVYFKKEETKSKVLRIQGELSFLRIYTRMNTYPEKGFGPYSKIPWGFSILKNKVSEEFLFTGSVDPDTLWKALEPLLTSKVVVFDNAYEIYKLADLIPSEDKKKNFLDSVVNLYSVFNHRLYFPHESSYDFSSFTNYFLGKNQASLTAESFLEVKEEQEVLKKIEKNTALRARMKSEAEDLSLLLETIKNS